MDKEILEKLENAISEFNTSHSMDSAMSIIGLIDRLYKIGSEVFVPFSFKDGKAGYRIVQDEGENWIVANTYDSGADNVSLIKLEDLFKDTLKNNDVSGIIVNPEDPFYIQRELILMNWYKENDVGIRVKLIKKESKIKRSEWKINLLKEDENYDKAEFGRVSLKVPDDLTDRIGQSAFMNRYWNLLEMADENRIESLFVKADLSKWGDEWFDISECLYISTYQWAKLNYEKKMQLRICCEDKESYDLTQEMMDIYEVSKDDFN